MPLFSSKVQLTTAASSSKLALADIDLIKGAFKVYPTLGSLQGESVNYFTDGQVVMVSASSQLYQASVFEPDYVNTFDYSASFAEFSFAGSGGGSGDITSVIAGSGLSGGANSGDATVTLDTSSAHFTTGVSASAAASGFGAGGGSGDITSVIAGSGLSGGASTGDATLTLDTSSTHFINAVSDLGLFRETGSFQSTTNNLEITGSLEVGGGLFKLTAFETTPTAEEGAIFYSASNFYFGFE